MQNWSWRKIMIFFKSRDYNCKIIKKNQNHGLKIKKKLKLQSS